MDKSSAERRMRVLGAHLGGPSAAAGASIAREKTSAAFASQSAQQHMEAQGVKVIGGMTKASAARTLELWHEAVEGGMAGGAPEDMLNKLDDVFADDILFLAPTYLKPRRNKEFVKYALLGVSKAFKNFKYTRAFLGDDGFALEFECNIVENDGHFMRGVDLITLNEAGRISKLEVMARPPKAVLKLLDFQTAFLREKGIIPPAKTKK